MTDLTEINNKALIAQLKNNNVHAFDRLFEKYSDKLYNFSMSILKNEEDSKEIVQEVFFRLWNERKKIDANKPVKSLLFTITYRIIIDYLRKQLKDRNFRKSLEKHFFDNYCEQKNHIDCDTLKREINKAVDGLPAKRQTIYRLSREKGLTHKKIAVRLDIEEKTVENQISLALKHIKASISKEFLPLMLFIILTLYMGNPDLPALF
ncbi:MAG: RNA polymerase sigma-70 factor [Prolixibacteraceae bacterium]|jgi:RNA polymerase sigma-70 factor (ECF subfamily)|nr:RNA polymerase sigma-70 factor [Prolixibacteraceae bacterium]MDD4754827.1 RNA polymerase sigma-70 factor [Prolixibacteraceae bacterium]NLO01119.1 RNA polymerase sigma-70 factor [Bacteroidales bacterium]